MIQKVYTVLLSILFPILPRWWNEEIYALLDDLINKMNYDKKIKIHIDYTQWIYNGSAQSKKEIVLSVGVVKDFKQNPLVLKSLLAHEFAHILNDDLIKQKRVDDRLEKHTAKLINIIKEIRAEIDGANMLGFTNKEINAAQNSMLNKNNNTKDIKKSYKNYKYPTRVQIKYFAKRFDELDHEVIHYFIESYFKHIGITNEKQKQEIRKRVAERFSNQG